MIFAELALRLNRPVSEFISQKLDSITLHGIVKGDGLTEEAYDRVKHHSMSLRFRARRPVG